MPYQTLAVRGHRSPVQRKKGVRKMCCSYFRNVIFLLAAFTVMRCAAAAGVDPGHVEGMVRDALERPIAGAKVQMQDATGRTVATTPSDAQGHFTISDVTPGPYIISVTASGFEQGTAVVTLNAAKGTSVDITLSSRKKLELTVVAKRLDEARNGLSPHTGTSLYRIDHSSVEDLAQGDNTPVNQVLEATPGVAQDSFGQIHVRGDHANVQYRINGIILPEGISGFGQSVDTRFADRIDFLTGALPAQYGYRTAGVVEIDTKSGAFAQGGQLSVYGGSRDWFEPSLQYSGSNGALSYFLTGSYLQNNIGIEGPTSAPNPIHDHTEQTKGFAYFSYLLNPTARLSATLGTSVGQFQIPNNPGQTASFTLSGVPNFDSSNLNEHQLETNHYGILALQGANGAGNYQVAVFSRYTSTTFTPDYAGDLIFNGVASQVSRSDWANGVQADASYVLNPTHTLRYGTFFSQERAISDNTSAVFPVDASGNQTSTLPISITDNNSKLGRLFSLYAQDEWKITQRLTLNYGLRADTVDAYVQEGQLSPRVNALYQLTSATAIHAGYSRFFTPPPTELVAPKDITLFQGTSNAPEVNAASNVKSERDNYYDVGVTHRASQALQLGLDAYYKDARHLLDEGQFGQALVFTPFNYAKGEVYGVEVSATYRKGNVSGYLNLARSVARATRIESSQFSFGQDELDYIASNWVYLDHDQRYTASAGLDYKLNGTTYGVDLMYGSGLRSGFANTDKLPGYTQVNASVRRSFDVASLGKLEARFTIVNLFDEVYELRDGSGIGVGAPQWGPRRGFYIGVSKSF
jgi:outer membrane receptor for ferrienterochelin and colicin